MGLDLPVRGDAGAGEWGDTWDEGAAKIDAHDHTTGKGARVPTAGLNINADMPFGAAYAPTQLHRVQFSAIAGGALTGSNNRSLFVSDGTSGLVANELYFRNASGNNVQLTSGNTINLSVAGGIGGDYASVGAQLNYDDSGKRYTLKEGTSDSNGWARIASGDLRLYPFGGSGTFYVGHAAPVGIAASYTATWPAALPGATSLVRMSSAGAVSFDAILPAATEIHHGDRTFTMSGSAVAASTNVSVSLGNAVSAGAATMEFAVGLCVGDRIKEITVAMFGDGAVDVQLLVKTQIPDGTTGTIALLNVNNIPASWGDTPLGVTDTTITSGMVVTLLITASAANLQVNCIRVTYDHP